MRFNYPTILNSKGKPIILTEKEDRLAKNLERKINNDLGLEINITTLTTIIKKVSEQKFFTVMGGPADYLPLQVGEGAWSSNIVTYRSFSIGDDFATGIINQGANTSRLAAVDTGVDSVTVKVIPWAKTIGFTLIELEQASKAGNWDIVTSKEESRLKNWQLGIQKVAFLGLAGDASALGLLTLDSVGVNTNTTTITKFISVMTAAELSTFMSKILADYRSNCNFTAMPKVFVMPELDYLGCATPSSSDFPLKSKLEIMLETFKVMTGHADFKIKPLAYGGAAQTADGKNTYVLHSNDEKSIRMNIPVDYTSTLANSNDNFSFSNVGYGMFTGAMAYRPSEIFYYKF